MMCNEHSRANDPILKFQLRKLVVDGCPNHQFYFRFIFWYTVSLSNQWVDVVNAFIDFNNE